MWSDVDWTRNEIHVYRSKTDEGFEIPIYPQLQLSHYTHRSLRRMFVLRAIEQGVPFHVVASWQGHRDGGRLIATTYGHLRTEYADEMAKRMTTPTTNADNLIPFFKVGGAA